MRENKKEPWTPLNSLCIDLSHPLVSVSSLRTQVCKTQKGRSNDENNQDNDCDDDDDDEREKIDHLRRRIHDFSMFLQLSLVTVQFS